jgi:excisionase family DNA binding protein
MSEPSESANSAELLTLSQAAAYLGVCRAHLYKLRAVGLPVIHLGRLVRINRESLQRWLDEQEHSTECS